LTGKKPPTFYPGRVKTPFLFAGIQNAAAALEFAHVTVVKGVPHVSNKQNDEADTLVPDSRVRSEFGDITDMTLWRWTRDPELKFPPPIKIRRHNFRSRRALEEFKSRMLALAIRQRAVSK
jgi:hypothetical protein